MPLPKKIKKDIPLTSPNILLRRREELLEKINKDGTYLPKSILHADLDGGFLDFVKNELKTTIDSGKYIPLVDIIITTQGWSQFTETWNFQDLDKNTKPPFLTIVRNPEVKFGTNPSLIYNIPNRKQYYYVQVPTWDGQRTGVDIYKIPQPVPVDITYSVKIICSRMRELNSFNQVVLEKFASRQAYTVIKGHYIPMVLNDIGDESVLDIEKRKYYIQSYSFTMLGFLLDENQFEVSPAISRVLTVAELETENIRRGGRNLPKIDETNFNVVFIPGNRIINEKIFYNTNLLLNETTNISSFSVFINNDYYGDDVNEIQINSGDVLKIEVLKNNNDEESVIIFANNKLL
jgi:hypothetical protein